MAFLIAYNYPKIIMPDICYDFKSNHVDSEDDSEDDSEPNLDWLDLAEPNFPTMKYPEHDLFHRVDAMVVSSRRQIIDSWTKK